MNEEQQEIASLAPFVMEFTLAIIMTLQGKPFYKPKQEVIHADMIPKFSDHVIQASMKEHLIMPRITPQPTIRFEMPRPIPQPRMIPPKQTPTPQQHTNEPNPEFAWQKIEPLLKDPAVTHIECPGPGRQLMVSRAGQRQITKITLTEKEIKKILETVAEQTHIPLLEGVFRTATEELSINAIISEIIGSKFVIKKNTPYSILEQ